MVNINLRPYQEDCEDGIRNAFIAGANTTIAVLPTGSGKTTIFGAICDKFLRKGATGRVGIVSHLGLLTAQTGDRFREEWGIESGVLQADRYPTRGTRCFITTMQTFCNETKVQGWIDRDTTRSCKPEEITLLIVDECHRMGSSSYNRIVANFPNAKIIGFTATPFRENKLMSDLFDRVAYTISTQELIDQGYLVPPKLNLTDYDTTDQASMFGLIANIYLKKHKGQKAVVYTKTIEEAELLRNVLVDMGITSSAVTSHLTGRRRDELLRDFRRGDGPSVLTTVDVLTAGFDSPNLRAIFMPYKVGSVTTYLQRVGRGLRPDKNKTHCDIYAGNKSPSIEAGFWEEINRQMLGMGKARTECATLDEELDFAADLSKEEYIWTQEVVAMAKEAKKKGMQALYDMIQTKKFPKAMLETFVAVPPMTQNKNHKAKPTVKQEAYLKGIGLYAEGLTKSEASVILEAHSLANGKKYADWEVVPHGKHKGKHFSKVPFMFWKYNKDYTLMAAHRKYKEKVKCK